MAISTASKGDIPAVTFHSQRLQPHRPHLLIALSVTRYTGLYKII